MAAAETRAIALEGKIRRTHLKPPPKLTLSQWADRYGMLSPEGSARPGPFSVDEAPYQREPMDAIGDPGIPLVILMWSSQTGKSQLLTLQIAYAIDQDPGPMLHVQPTLDMAETFSKDRVAPMIRDTPRLRDKVADVRARDSSNTLLRKAYPGGQLAIGGANSPAGLAARAIRYLQLDEVDRFPRSAGSEGSPSGIAESRTSTFPNAKVIKSSSPTVENESEIYDAYEATDQREYWVPCPHCLVEQRLVFGGLTLKYGLKWDLLPDGDIHAYYVCEPCGAVIEEADKRWMLAHGRWIRGQPDRKAPGFRISAIYSPFFSWHRLVTRWFRDRKDPEKLKTFVNTLLCELWKELAGDRLDPESLLSRLEECYQPKIPNTQETDRSFVPPGVGVIVRTVDTQGDRLETAVWGFGEREECWIIDFDMLAGDPSIPFGSPLSPWNELDALIRQRVYRHAGVVPMQPFPTFIDSGGHAAGEVYAFTKQRNRIGVFAIKGSSEQAIGPLLGKPTRNNNAKAILFPVGVYAGKESVFKRIGRIQQPGPGYLHLPDWMTGEQVSQLTNERLKLVVVNGRSTWRWIQTGPNEMFDLAVYALAALQYLPANVRLNLGELSKQYIEQAAAEKAQQSADPSTTPAPTGTEEAPEDEGYVRQGMPPWRF